MELVPWLLNIGTTLFFVASFPQMIRSYKRRKEALQDFSVLSWILCWIGCIFMATVDYFEEAYIALAIEGWHTIYHFVTLYWIFKYQKKVNYGKGYNDNSAKL